MSSKTNLVYIMGRGRSGSTILDVLLGSGNDIESVGELISGLYCYESEVCSCGDPFLKCDFWTSVRMNFERRTSVNWKQAARLSVTKAHLKKFLPTLISSSSTGWVIELRSVTDDLIQSILKVNGKQVVVDSSKEFTRGLFLARFLNNAKIIHLVRHPERHLASHYYRMKQGLPFLFLRHYYSSKRFASLFLMLRSISWVAGNALAEIIRLYAPSRYIRVRYEDLCSNPRMELERIEQFIQQDLQPLIEQIEKSSSMLIGHNLGGNEFRFDEAFKFNPRAGSIKLLPWYYSILVRLISWPLMLRYGYSLFRNSISEGVAKI